MRPERPGDPPHPTVKVHQHINDDDLELYVFGRVSLAERYAIEKALQSCPDCRQHLEETRQFIAQLAEVLRRQPC